MTIGCCLQLQLASAQSAEIQQLILDIEKLTQMKQLLSDMKTGYDVVSNGYGTIKNISQGNFNLHDAFLNGLLTVNPELRKYKRVADIISYQATILSEYKSAYSSFQSGGRFSADEISYMGRVYSRLFDGSLENIDQLTMILTDSKLRMSDAERLKAIDGLYFDMQGRVSFLRNFNKQTATLDAQRQQAMKDNSNLKAIYGVQ